MSSPKLIPSPPCPRQFSPPASSLGHVNSYGHFSRECCRRRDGFAQTGLWKRATNDVPSIYPNVCMAVRDKTRDREADRALFIDNCWMALHELLICSHTGELLSLRKMITLGRYARRQPPTLCRWGQLASCMSRETGRCSAYFRQVKWTLSYYTFLIHSVQQKCVKEITLWLQVLWVGTYSI